MLRGICDRQIALVRQRLDSSRALREQLEQLQSSCASKSLSGKSELAVQPVFEFAMSYGILHNQLFNKLLE